MSHNVEAVRRAFDSFNRNDVWRTRSAYRHVEGALSFPSSDPIGAVEQAVGFVEAIGRAHGIENPIQMTLGFTDGERLYAVRYSTEHRSRTLFVSERGARCQSPPR